ncbi:MAG TPA: hypothetical protein VI356_14085 [Myxococcales bacterium]
MSKLCALSLVLALYACAGTSKVVQDPRRENLKVASLPGTPPPEGKILCQVERPTGSNIAERVCRYVNQNDWSAARSQDMLREVERERLCKEGCPQPSSGNR